MSDKPQSGAKPPRRHRRVHVPGVAGSDPNPSTDAGDRSNVSERESARSWGDGDDSNDERLRRDVPPHW